jgi:hypothetical protein
MRLFTQKNYVEFFCMAVLCVLWTAADAQAYVDPGTTGMLTQLLYVLFYGMLGLFLYCLRYIKQIIAGGRSYLARFLTGKKNN